MLHDLDAALGAFLRDDVAAGEAEVSFDPPTAGWATTIDGQVLNAYLLDVREDIGARTGDWSDVRDDGGSLIGIQPPVRRYAATYLVSAWAADTVAEHRLLGRVLAALPPYDCIPDRHLVGELADSGLSVRLTVGQFDRTPELWSSFGVSWRTSIVLVATAPVKPPLLTDLAPAADRLDIGLDGRRGRPGQAPVPQPRETEPFVDDGEPAARDADHLSGAGRPSPGTSWTKYRVRERLDQA